MRQYLDIVRHVLEQGQHKGGPQKTGTLAAVGMQMRFDLNDGFPLITTRSLKGSWKALRAELLWLLSGSTNLEGLHAMDVHFWDTWGTPDKTEPHGRQPGDLGPIYGHQWRNFSATRNADGSYNQDGFDQIAWLIEDIRRRPDNRRHLVSSWNLNDFENRDGSERVFIAPCHGIFHITHFDGELTMHHIQRSGDLPIGVPFNIGSYALLLMMIAQVTGFKARHLIHTISDAHIYENQIPAMQELLSREPRPLPTVRLNPGVKDIFKFTLDDIELLNYDPHPPIKSIPVEE